MIAGHSNGQPSRNSSMTTNASITIGGTGSATIASVTQFAVPMRANTAPKMFDVTASSNTMLEVVVAVIAPAESLASYPVLIMIGPAMMPSTVTAAPTMPVAIANTAEVTITTI